MECPEQVNPETQKETGSCQGLGRGQKTGRSVAVNGSWGTFWNNENMPELAVMVPKPVNTLTNSSLYISMGWVLWCVNRSSMFVEKRMLKSNGM